MSGRKEKQKRRGNRRQRPRSSGGRTGAAHAALRREGTHGSAELEDLLERYVRLKQELVRWVQRRHSDAILGRARELSQGGAIAERDIIRATEAEIHKSPATLDAFLAAHRGLRGPDRVLVRSWKEGFESIFRPLKRDGRLVTLHNLVDDLDYPTALSVNDPGAWQQFDEFSFVVTHLLPLGPVWTLSGVPRPLDPADPRIADGMAAMYRAGCRVFVEIGPAPVLSGMGGRCLKDPALRWIASLRRGGDDPADMLGGLAELYVSGADVDWTRVDRGNRRRGVVLPTYPFQRERCWVKTAPEPAKPPTGAWPGSRLHLPFSGEIRRMPSSLVSYRKTALSMQTCTVVFVEYTI